MIHNYGMESILETTSVTNTLAVHEKCRTRRNHGALGIIVWIRRETKIDR